MYHVPSDVTWDPDSVAESLRRREHNARTVEHSVWLSLRPSPSNSICDLSADITISFNPTRFIRNVELKYDQKSIPFDSPCFGDIAAAMKEHGYISGTDREIAAHYLPALDELAERFDELERLQIQKVNLVADQEFERACIARDKEERLRSEIDAMLVERVRRR